MVWIGVAVGLIVGVVLGVLVARRAIVPAVQEEPPQVDYSPTPTIPVAVDKVLTAVRGASVIVGPHDELLSATPQARALGIVRGTRIGFPNLLEATRLARRTDRLQSIELEVKRGPGITPLHLTCRMAPVGDGLVVLIADDRTTAKRFEATHRDLVANVSHELKTPIGAISLLSEAVEEAADDPESVKHFAGKLQEETVRLGELVGQIINLSRLQSDEPLQRAEPCDVATILSEAVDQCRELARGKSVDLTLVTPKGLEVLGDHKQLVSAVKNIVHNGIVYSDAGARVAVSAKGVLDDEESYVDILVSDNGIGITPADQQRIFERFYRVDYGRSRANGGTGLGLSIVKHIAAVHGGNVTVWSQPGQGSTFTLRIPAHVPHTVDTSPGADIAERNGVVE